MLMQLCSWKDLSRHIYVSETGIYLFWSKRLRHGTQLVYYGGTFGYTKAQVHMKLVQT